MVDEHDRSGGTVGMTSARGPNTARVLLRMAAGPEPSNTDIDAVAQSADEWQTLTGEALITEGHVAPQGFVVLSGTVSLIVNGRTIARLSPGSGILPDPDLPMPLSAVADERCWLLLLSPVEMALLRRS